MKNCIFTGAMTWNMNGLPKTMNKSVKWIQVEECDTDRTIRGLHLECLSAPKMVIKGLSNVEILITKRNGQPAYECKTQFDCAAAQWQLDPLLTIGELMNQVTFFSSIWARPLGHVNALFLTEDIEDAPVIHKN